jgi:hypothetical protein
MQVARHPIRVFFGLPARNILKDGGADGELQARIIEPVVERTHPERVAGQEDGARRRVEDGEGKIAQQVSQAIRSPAQVGLQDEGGVADWGLEIGDFRLEIGEQALAVVEAGPGGDDQAALRANIRDAFVMRFGGVVNDALNQLERLVVPFALPIGLMEGEEGLEQSLGGVAGAGAGRRVKVPANMLANSCYFSQSRAL